MAQLEPHVEAEDKKGKIKTQAKAPSNGDLPVKRLIDVSDGGARFIDALVLPPAQEELRAAAAGILLQGPDIAGIEEKRAINHPEDIETVFQAAFEAKVASLEQASIIAAFKRQRVFVSARAQATRRPGTDAVGAAHKELLDIRHIRGEAEGAGYADGKTRCYAAFGRVLPVGAQIQPGAGILRKAHGFVFADAKRQGVGVLGKSIVQGIARP